MRISCILLPLAILLHGCNSPVTPTAMGDANYTSPVKDVPVIKGTDSILILQDHDIHIAYTRKYLDTILRNAPELNKNISEAPEVLYAKSQSGSFGSEAGQDVYYTLYAYFLKQRNGTDLFAVKRDTLTDIYRLINELYGNLVNGGTYYAHQGLRLYANAEYYIYRYSLDSSYYKKPYSISRQRELFISGLRQLINDEVDNDNNNGLTEKDKTSKKVALLAIIDRISADITNYFYLHMAIRFNGTYYQ